MAFVRVILTLNGALNRNLILSPLTESSVILQPSTMTDSPVLKPRTKPLPSMLSMSESIPEKMRYRKQQLESKTKSLRQSLIFVHHATCEDFTSHCHTNFDRIGINRPAVSGSYSLNRLGLIVNTSFVFNRLKVAVTEPV